LELFKNREALTSGTGVGPGAIAIGFVISFVVALVVIKAFVHFVSRSGFSPFGWYRIVVGAAALLWLGMR
jgi:undecaprenyl-diphosphatase